MDAKNEISARFIAAFEALLNRGQVSDRRDFATKIGISASMVTEISKGRSSVGTSAIQNIVSYFNIDADWLLTGRGGMIKQGESTDVSQPQSVKTPSVQASPDIVSTLLATIQEQLSTIQKQAEEIGRLKECLRQADMVKGKNVSDAHTEDIANAG